MKEKIKNIFSKIKYHLEYIEYLWIEIRHSSFVKLFFPTKYHIINLKKFKGSWVDCDIKIVYAVFESFKECVEKENCLTTRAWSHDYEIEKYRSGKWGKTKKEREEEIKFYQLAGRRLKRHRKELQEIYDWWLIRRNQDVDVWDEAYEKDSANLIKLIKLRGYLWS